MIPFLKKTSRDSASEAVLMAWHPNFRNFEKLPDIKVVRTTFFVNGAAILVATSLIIYTIYKELELSALVKETELSQSIVTKNKAQSELAIAQFKKFQEQERKIIELKDFLTAEKIKLSEFIVHVGKSLEPAITIVSIDYNATSVKLRGGIKGSSEEAAKLAQTYVDDLGKNPYFSGLFSAFTLTSIVRDPSSGDMRFEIDLTFFKPGSKPAGGNK
jgi:hypothetical protein